MKHALFKNDPLLNDFLRDMYYIPSGQMHERDDIFHANVNSNSSGRNINYALRSLDNQVRTGLMHDDYFEKDALLRAFAGDIYYVLSDQMHERDDIFRMPVRIRSNLLKHARVYFDYLQSLSPLSPVHNVYSALKNMLENWKASGEDVDRILQWYKSICGWGVAKSTSHWRHMFWWWSKGWFLDCQRHLPRERFEEFQLLLHSDFIVPMKDFEALTRDDEEKWVGDGGSRSEWDEYLWNIFFKNVWIAPEVFYQECFHTLNMMTFWKKHRHFLSLGEQELLLADMTDVLVLRDKGMNEIDWDNVATLEDTLTIDDWPDFDTVKRDW